MMVDEDRVHYHHIAGMGGGYMPDDHGLYDSFESAVQSIEDDISRDTDYGSDSDVRDFVRMPTVRPGHEAYWIGYYPEDVSPHDLGWYFEVFEARDDAPDHEDCRAILNGEKEYPLS